MFLRRSPVGPAINGLRCGSGDGKEDRLHGIDDEGRRTGNKPNVSVHYKPPLKHIAHRYLRCASILNWRSMVKMRLWCIEANNQCSGYPCSSWKHDKLVHAQDLCQSAPQMLRCQLLRSQQYCLSPKSRPQPDYRVEDLVQKL